MAREAREFWQALERRLPEEERGREREIAESVLVLLRHRILPEEAQHLKAEFPDELKELWARRRIGMEEEHSARAVVDLDHNWFLEGVRELADLPDLPEAARATAAVFGAVREIISDTEAEHLEDQLPSGLRELWRGEWAHKGPHIEEGWSPFWSLVDRRLDGQVPATTTEVACSVLAHLRGRLSAELVKRIGSQLPSDVREYWVAPEPGVEAHEQPERFLGRIAQDLRTSDLDAARHAAISVLGVLEQFLPDDVSREVENQLPEELRGFWDQK